MLIQLLKDNIFRYYTLFEMITRIFVTAMITCTIIALLVVCNRLCKTLKQHFKEFYEQERCFIIGMTAALTFSALCRVGSIVWLTYEGDEFEMLMYDSALYNSYSMPLYLTA